MDRYDAGARTHTADDARLAPSFAIPARSVPRIRPRSRETCSLSGRKIEDVGASGGGGGQAIAQPGALGRLHRCGRSRTISDVPGVGEWCRDLLPWPHFC